MRRSNTFRPRLLVPALLAAAMALPLHAQEAVPAAPPPSEHPDAVVTPPARAVLERMRAHLNSLQSFTVQAHASRDELLAYGYKLQNNETATMTVQRPNRLRVDVDGDIKKRSYFYDGTTLTMYAPDEGVYSRVAAPGTIAEVVSQLLERGVEMPMIDVLAQGFAGTLLQDVRAGRLVGETTIDGVLTDHLAFRQPLVDWQIWVAKDGAPKRLLITTRYALGDPQYEVTMDWNPKARVAESTFRFSPPDGVREVPVAARTAPEAAAPTGSP